MNLIQEYEWRGLVFDKTDGIHELIQSGSRLTAYIGFDPTAASLHVGNLLPIMGLVHLQRCGHRPIALVGGATGMIGDPSGKSKERNLLDNNTLAHNVACIRQQLSKFLDFEDKNNGALLVNNADWVAPMTFIDFMRDVGKHFSVAAMINKESVKRRISGEGISFTEFSYMILQAYDFFHLYKTYGCQIQMGGSDQWGNITAGTDLIRRQGGTAHGIVYPLVTTASGAKFGKSESGAIWLDPKLTSPYAFYQFWLNAADEDALKYLKIFSTLDQPTIEELGQRQIEAPNLREIQKRLAEEVTLMVHGREALDRAQKATRELFAKGSLDLSAEDFDGIAQDIPCSELPAANLEGEGYSLVNLVAECGLAPSNGESRKLIKAGGVNLNNQRVEDMNRKITLADAIEGRYMLLRKGAKQFHLIKLVR